MKKLLLLIAILTLSCKSSNIISSSQEKTQTIDSSLYREKIIYKDSIIYLAGDTIPYAIPCDVDTAYIINSKLGYLQIQVNHGKVTGAAVIKEKNLVIEKISKELESVRNSRKDSIVTKTEFKETIKFKIPKWAVYHIIGFWTLVIFLGLRIYLKYFKKV